MLVLALDKTGDCIEYRVSNEPSQSMQMLPRSLDQQWQHQHANAFSIWPLTQDQQIYSNPDEQSAGRMKAKEVFDHDAMQCKVEAAA
jgi:hypothetical protein